MTAFWLGKGTLKQALVGDFQVQEEKPGRGAGRLALQRAVRRAAGRRQAVLTARTSRRGRRQGQGVRAPGRRLGRRRRGRGDRVSSTSPPAPARRTSSWARPLGLPVIAPLDEAGHYIDGFGWLTGRDATRRDRRDRRGPASGRASSTVSRPSPTAIPHCWRCGTPLLFRLVDEWFISMGPVYDQPRETLTREQVDASLRYQIMEVVDQIRWIPGFGYDRELDWLLNMHDWMISKKRYYGLALPIYDCQSCGTFTVVGGREELREKAIAGWEEFEGHTPHRPYVDAVRIACSGMRRACLANCRRRQSVAGRRNRAVLDAPLPRGARLLVPVVPGRLHHGELPGPVPELVLLAARDVDGPSARAAVQDDLRLCTGVRRRRAPDAQVVGQRHRLRRGRRADGRRRHALGVRQRARPEENILFGWHVADEARRELLVLWNVYAFFVTYARLAGWTPAEGIDPADGATRPGPRSTAGSCRARRGSRPAWRTGCAITTRSQRRARSRRSSTTSRRGTCACRGTGCAAAVPDCDRRRGRQGPRVRDAPRRPGDPFARPCADPARSSRRRCTRT